MGIDWSPDSLFLITGDYLGVIKIWECQTGIEINNLEGHSAPIQKVAWSTQLSLAASGSDDGNVAVWNTQVREYYVFNAHENEIKGISVSRDEQYLLSCSEDG